MDVLRKLPHQVVAYLWIFSLLSVFLVDSYYHEVPIRVCASIAGAAVGVALLIPHPISLTVSRIGVPIWLVAVLSAGSRAHTSSLFWGCVALQGAISLYCLSPAWAHLCVNVLSYGDERRFTLRVPSSQWLVVGVAWLLIALPIWAALGFATTNGPQAAIAAIAIAGLNGWFFGSRLYHLSKRILVFVPAGVVIADSLAMPDPVLFHRELVERVALASSSTDAVDLTGKTLGYSLQLDLVDRIPLTLKQPGSKDETGRTSRVLIAPLLYGEVLQVAEQRGLARGVSLASTPPDPAQ